MTWSCHSNDVTILRVVMVIVVVWCRRFCRFVTRPVAGRLKDIHHQFRHCCTGIQIVVIFFLERYACCPHSAEFETMTGGKGKREIKRFPLTPKHCALLLRAQSHSRCCDLNFQLIPLCCRLLPSSPCRHRAVASMRPIVPGERETSNQTTTKRMRSLGNMLFRLFCLN